MNEDDNSNDRKSSSVSLVSDFKSKQRWTRLFLAITLVLMTDICNTINNALIKGIHLNSIDVLLVRSIIQTIVLGVIIKWQGLVFLPMDKRKDWWKSLFALISAGISGTAVVLLCYLSVTLIPMGDAMALVFSSPLITLFIEWCASRFSLGKKWAIQFFSAFVLLAGVFFVIQPPFMNLNKNEKIPNNLTQTAVRVPTDFDQFGGQGRDVEDKTSYERYLGTGAALLASLISSLYVVFSRYVSQREFVEPIVIAFYSGVIGLIIAVVLGPTVFDSDRIMSLDISSITAREWGFKTLVGILSMTGYYFQTASLQWISASSLSALKSLEVLFAYFVQTIIMAQATNDLAIGGATMILFGVTGISLATKLQKYLFCQTGTPKEAVEPVQV